MARARRGIEEREGFGVYINYTYYIKTIHKKKLKKLKRVSKFERIHHPFCSVYIFNFSPRPAAVSNCCGAVLDKSERKRDYAWGLSCVRSRRRR